IVSPNNMTIDVNTGLIEWTPTEQQIGPNIPVTVRAANIAGSDDQSFGIDVSGIIPQISSIPPTTATAGVPYSYDVDANGTPEPTYELIVSPNNMTIDVNTGLIEWIPEPNQIGDVNVIVEASNIVSFDTQSFTITVFPSDNFDDNKRSAMWRSHTEDYSNIWVLEDTNRLNLRATGDINDLVAFYVANDWEFEANEDFAVEIDFHYSVISDQNGWVAMIVEDDHNCASISAGSDNNESYFYYEVVADGNVVFEREPRDSNDGTLYIWYDADSNSLHISHVGYQGGNAYIWQCSSPVEIAIGGGSDGVTLSSGNAYLDNFKIIRAKLIGWPPATDLDGDGFTSIGDIAIMNEYWLCDPNADPNVKGNLNNDDIVNFLDFAEFGLVW
ncbi:MAG: hypothetical protein JXB29_01870, partial [Sedimentisphaerales bacterium]|nr:hypothetical protein [Sedimentisphaerales bacterium]